MHQAHRNKEQDPCETNAKRISLPHPRIHMCRNADHERTSNTRQISMLEDESRNDGVNDIRNAADRDHDKHVLRPGLLAVREGNADAEHRDEGYQ